MLCRRWVASKQCLMEIFMSQVLIFSTIKNESSLLKKQWIIRLLLYYYMYCIVRWKHLWDKCLLFCLQKFIKDISGSVRSTIPVNAEIFKFLNKGIENFPMGKNLQASSNFLHFHQPQSLVSYLFTSFCLRREFSMLNSLW